MTLNNDLAFDLLPGERIEWCAKPDWFTRLATTASLVGTIGPDSTRPVDVSHRRVCHPCQRMAQNPEPLVAPSSPLPYW